MKAVGARLPRYDGVAHVTGRSTFVDDVRAPGTLWTKALRSPVHHAGITRLDTSRAEALRGVRAVVTHADVPWAWGPLKHVLVSPVYHHWHHSDAEDARDKNFVSHFPWIDLLFGTLYLPKASRPRRYGTPDAVASTYLRQLADPFAR